MGAPLLGGALNRDIMVPNIFVYCDMVFVFQGIPPRGKKPNKLREKNSQINRSLEEMLAKMENTQLFNSDLYVQPDGMLTPCFLPLFVPTTPF